MKRWYYLFPFFILTGFTVWYVHTPSKLVFGEPALKAMDLYTVILPWRLTAVFANMEKTNENILTLMVVCSAAENFSRRQAIRQTWGQTHGGRLAKVVFLLGRPLNYTLQTDIRNEYAAHGDMIQEDFFDTHHELSLKSLFMLKQFLEYYTSAQYLLKANDDVIVMLDNLPNFLLGLKNRKNVLKGYRYAGALPNRNPGSKSFVSWETYPYPIYPDYLSGFCYLMDRSVARKLFTTAMDMKGIFPLEDVFMTGFVAEKAGVQRIHAPEFALNAQLEHNCDIFYPTFVAAGHRITGENLVKAWKDWNCSYKPGYDSFP